jgi:hypothetical protein
MWLNRCCRFIGGIARTDPPSTGILNDSFLNESELAAGQNAGGSQCQCPFTCNIGSLSVFLTYIYEVCSASKDSNPTISGRLRFMRGEIFGWALLYVILLRHQNMKHDFYYMNACDVWLVERRRRFGEGLNFPFCVRAVAMFDVDIRQIFTANTLRQAEYRIF